MKHKRQKKSDTLFAAKAVALILTVVVILMAVLVAIALRKDRAAPDSRIDAEPMDTAEPEATSTAAPTDAPTDVPTDAPTEPPTEAPTEPSDPSLEAAQSLLDTMSLHEKLCQMLFVTPETLTGSGYVDIAGELTRQSLETYPVGGIIYFSQNLQSPEQVTNLIANSQSYSEIPLFIGVDEEGGLVSRLSGIGITTALEPMATYGAAGDADAVEAIGANLAEELKSVGFNLDFAPVADIVTNPNNTEIGNRSFSSDPDVAAKMVSAMTDGLQSSGVIACLKHFPGHGSTEADSHYGQSVTYRTLEELREAELIPFRAGIDAGVGMVMISHMSVPEINGDNTPCDLSYSVVTELLRNELGYDGVVITDSHLMESVTNYYTTGEAAVKAVAAGCDIILMPADIGQALSALEQAISDGTLTEERIDASVLRILKLKAEYGLIS